ncbi:Mllt3p [Blomia tropicalis]|nr:Mllt3p [Blomia tropicalis]
MIVNEFTIQTVYVRGVDDAKINYFIEKVIFQLHESFPKPKRVIKEPPYQISESGYASFDLPIYVYFRNRLEPKSTILEYDMTIDLTKPITKFQREKLTFQNPSEEFKKKLLKGGGILSMIN